MVRSLYVLLYVLCGFFLSTTVSKEGVQLQIPAGLEVSPSSSFRIVR